MPLLSAGIVRRGRRAAAAANRRAGRALPLFPPPAFACVPAAAPVPLPRQVPLEPAQGRHYPRRILGRELLDPVDRFLHRPVHVRMVAQGGAPVKAVQKLPHRRIKVGKAGRAGQPNVHVPRDGPLLVRRAGRRSQPVGVPDRLCDHRQLRAQHAPGRVPLADPARTLRQYPPGDHAGRRDQAAGADRLQRTENFFGRQRRATPPAASRAGRAAADRAVAVRTCVRSKARHDRLSPAG